MKENKSIRPFQDEMNQFQHQVLVKIGNYLKKYPEYKFSIQFILYPKSNIVGMQSLNHQIFDEENDIIIQQPIDGLRYLDGYVYICGFNFSPKVYENPQSQE